MAGWDDHFNFARGLGIKIDRETARQIDHFLDKPNVDEWQLSHKALHNDLGVKLAKLVWGELGEEYVKAHLRLDRTPVNKRRIPPPTPKKIVVEPKTPANSPGTQFGDLVRMFILLGILKYFLPG